MIPDDEETAPGPAPDRFERLAAVVGDLDSPFYDEERDRDVWNEASAVGFQLLLWVLPVVGAALLWTLGARALLPVAALLVPWGLASVVTMTYAQRRAVRPGVAEAMGARPGRALAFGVVVAALAAGALRAAAELSVAGALGSFLRGAAQGGAGALVVVAVASAVIAVRGRRRARATRP